MDSHWGPDASGFTKVVFVYLPRGSPKAPARHVKTTLRFTIHSGGDVQTTWVTTAPSLLKNIYTLRKWRTKALPTALLHVACAPHLE